MFWLNPSATLWLLLFSCFLLSQPELQAQAGANSFAIDSGEQNRRKLKNDLYWIQISKPLTCLHKTRLLVGIIPFAEPSVITCEIMMWQIFPISCLSWHLDYKNQRQCFPRGPEDFVSMTFEGFASKFPVECVPSFLVGNQLNSLLFPSFLYSSIVSSQQPPTLAAASTWSPPLLLPVSLPGARRGVTCFVLCAGHWLAARWSLCQ